MPNNLTITTAFWDIKRGEMGNDFARSTEHYLECGARLLQEVKFPMVIYVPEELNEFVWKHRSPENTRVVNKPLESIRTSYFPFYDKLQTIRTNPEWYSQAGWLEQSPQAKLPDYAPITMIKMFLLHDSACMNPFNTDYHLWVDFGLSNSIGSLSQYTDNNFQERITPYMNKMLYVAFPYDTTTHEIHGFKRDAMINYTGGVNPSFVCRGGVFGAHKEVLHEMNDIYYQLLNSTLSDGYLGTEESIFTIIANKYPNKVNIRMIDGNGLVYKFFQDLVNEPIKKPKEHPLALYFLVFNTPKQFEYTLSTWKTAYPKEFKECKKYVVNNSNDPSVDEEYKRIFKENDMEEFKFDNIGINSGRRWVAEHFDKTDHDYYIFVEEDMLACTEVGVCKNGLSTYYGDGLFAKMIEILNNEKLDCLRLTFTEFFGDCFTAWQFQNFNQERKDKYFPAKEGFIASKEYMPNTLNKPKINYLGVFKGIPYVVGGFHISNWPILYNKNGSKLVYLETRWKFEYEQTTMALASDLWEEGRIKTGSLLASVIRHERFVHYSGEKRRENETYTN